MQRQRGELVPIGESFDRLFYGEYQLNLSLVRSERLSV